MTASGVIVGLGNPGPKYRETRHNAGFQLAERLAERWGGAWRDERKFFASLAECRFGERRWLLCRPQTYMNASGEAVGPLATFHRVPPDRVLVLVDDADLPLGTLRLRPEGSPGGHHGLESVEQHLGTRGYPRLRLGIARPEQTRRDLVGHVLGQLTDADRPAWELMLQRAATQVECWATAGISVAMNRHNGPASTGSDTSVNAERKTQ
ncbi:MAG: aminoacyl-tRNA hydrolase [Verrucomicrobia bacterium]|nr:aminoacyl-tRNA hydrolase [Verrucomicrobiota bacterium]